MNPAGFYFFIPKILKIGTVAAVMLAIFLHPFVPNPVFAVSTDVVISEVQTGGSGSETAAHEFVELKNNGAETIGIQDWKLVYSSSTDTTQNVLIAFDGQIPAGGSVLVVSQTYVVPVGVLPDRIFESSSSMSATGGHIKLIDNQGLERDRIGWGAAQFAENISAPAPLGGSSLQRIQQDSDDNSKDFVVDVPSPTGGDLEPLTEPAPAEYLPLRITELLPDPASPKLDSQDEFIEIYNPNDQPVNTRDYRLQAGNNFQYEFVLAAYQIPAKSYVVLYASETNLTLSNTSSLVRILDPAGQTLDTTTLYTNIGEGKSWALIDNKWQITNQVTPAAANKSSIAVAETSSKSSSGLKPCNPDQFRNPETNRCKKITTASGLTPCRVGQYRNPATNRCKNNATTASILKPCAANQFRNPATNRCKKTGSETTLVPCKAGQERNAETNRCRKVAGISATSPLANPASASANKTSVNYPAIAAIGLLGIAYGLYEYRQEIKSRILKVFSKSSNH